MGKEKFNILSTMIQDALEELVSKKGINLEDERTQDLINDAILNLLPEVSEVILNSIESDFATYEEHSLERQRFETALGKRWARPIKLLETLTTISIESAELFGDIYAKEAVDNNDLVFEVIRRIHARACQISNEILCLLRGGFADGALARWRTMHELAVTAFFISDHGNQIAEQYLEYENIEIHKEMVEYKRKCCKLGYEPLTNEEVHKIKQQKNKAIGKYGPDFYNDYGWTLGVLSKEKRNFKGIEEAVDLDHWRPYYKMACNNIHSGPKGNNYRIGLIYNQSNQEILLCGPSNYGLADPGQNTAISLTQISTCLLTIEPNYDIIFALKVMEMLSDRVCDEFVKVQLEIEAEEELHV